MHRSNIRIMKMDRNDRSILMRALYADFAPTGRWGCPMAIWPQLITKLHETRPGKLPLDDAEFRLARNSLNHLRNERIAARPGTPMRRMPRCANSSGPNRRCGCSDDPMPTQLESPDACPGFRYV